MNGKQFHQYIQTQLVENDPIGGTDFLFIKVRPNKALQFQINPRQRKSTPYSILVNAVDTYNLHPTHFTNKWLLSQNCNSGGCVATAINGLIMTYLL